MDKKTRYYKVSLGLDVLNTDRDESFYVVVNEDKTITAVKEATNGHPKITLRPLLKELTAREYMEETNKLMNQGIGYPQSLESRIDNMKE